jgi:hypothetical protein
VKFSLVYNECGAVGGLAELWVDNLPWLTLLVLMEPGGIFLDWFETGTGGLPGYHFLCSNGKENLCSGLTSATLTNVAGGVMSVFDATAESFSCTIGTGETKGEGGITKDLEVGTLSISSI